MLRIAVGIDVEVDHNDVKADCVQQVRREHVLAVVVFIALEVPLHGRPADLHLNHPVLGLVVHGAGITGQLMGEQVSLNEWIGEVVLGQGLAGRIFRCNRRDVQIS